VKVSPVLSGSSGPALTKRKKMYYILEKHYNRVYAASIKNHEFPSLQAAEKKLQALKELGDEEWFIVTRVQA